MKRACVCVLYKGELEAALKKTGAREIQEGFVVHKKGVGTDKWA